MNEEAKEEKKYARTPASKIYTEGTGPQMVLGKLKSLCMKIFVRLAQAWTLFQRLGLIS